MKRPLSTLLLIAAACGSGAQRPVITVFVAAPAAVTAGESTQLVFSASGGARLTLDPGGIDVTGRTSLTVTPAADTTYTLTATNEAGSASRTAFVAVNRPAPAAFRLTQLVSAVAGVPVSFTVAAVDASGAVNTGYRGTVQFATDDTQGLAPGVLTFAPSDQGQITARAVFRTAGERTFVVEDAAVPSALGVLHLLVEPAAAASLALESLPATAVAGSVVTLGVTSFDPYQNVATGFGGTVHFAATDPGAQLPVDLAFTAADAGSATFPVQLTRAGTTTVTVSSPGLAPATGVIAVTPGPAAQVTLEGLPAQVPVDATQSLTVTVRDAFGNPVPDYAGTLHFSDTDARASAIPDLTFTAADLGVHVVALQFATTGTQTLSAADSADASISGSASTQVTHGPVTALLVSGLPAATVAGSPLAATVTAVDRHGNVVTDFAGSVHFAASDAGAALPADYRFTAADLGSRAFPVVLIAAQSSSVVISSAGVPSVTSTVAVGHAGAAQVTLEGLPAQAVADAPQNVSAVVRDSFRNVVTDYAGTLRFTTTDAQAQPIADAAFGPADLGARPVTVRFGTAGPQALSAADTVSPSIAGSASTLVTHGAAAALVLAGIPPSTVAGTTLKATVTAVDGHGNVVTDFAGSVHFASSDPDAAVSVDYGFAAADAGSHTFPVLLTRAGTTAITASSPPLAAASASIAVLHAAPAQLTLEGLPAQAVADATQTLTVTVRDAFGNPVTDASNTIHFANTDPAASPLPDATFVAADLGVKRVAVQFATAGTQSVSASDALSPSVAGSASTQVVHGPAARLLLSQVPPSAVAGTLLPATVTAVDAHGNLASDFAGTVRFSSPDPSAQLPADFTFAAANLGSHTFAVALFRAGASGLTVSSAPLAPATAGVDVRHSTATQVTLAGLPAQVAVDVSLNVTVTVRDAFGNVVTDYSGALRFGSSDPRATALPDAAFLPADLGVKVVAVQFATAGAQSLTASDTATPSIAGSASTVVLHGAATRLLLAGMPPSTVAGALIVATVTAVDVHGNVATDFTGTVQFSSSDAAAQLPADSSFAAADLGSRNFPVVLAGAGTTSVTVTASGLSPATASVSVRHAGAAQVTLAGLPSQVVVDAVQTLTVTVRDAFANPVTDYAGTLRFASSDAQATPIPDATFVSADLGVKAVTTQFGTAGTQSVSASDTLKPSIAGSATTLVGHGPVARLLLSGLPQSAVAGALLTTAVTAADSHGNVVTDFSGTVHFASTDPAASLPADTAFTVADKGLRSFSAALTTAGARSVSVSQVGGGALAASASVTVVNAPASRITLDAHAPQVAVDTSAVFTVTMRDRFGNPALDYAGTVHFVSSDLAATAVPDLAFSASMFATADVSLQFATAGDQSLIATDTVNSALAGSAAIRVVSGPAVAYALSALPASAVAGDPLSLTVTAVDAHGNTVLNYAGSAAFTSGDATDRLPAAGAFSAGVRSGSLSFVTAGPHRATVSEVGGTLRADTSTVTIAPGNAAALSLTDGAAVAGGPASTTVVARDAFGNVAVSYAGTVAVTSTDPQSIASAPYTFTAADAGQHVFPLTLRTAGTWSAVATDAANALSGRSTFSVSPAAATSCSLLVLGRSGSDVALRLAVADPFANLATGYRGTMTLTSSDAAAQLPPSPTYTAADAGSRDLSAVLPTPGDQTIRATDAASAFSCQANVSIVGAQFFAVTFSGTEAWAGTARAATVQAQDATGAPLLNYAGTIAFSSSDTAASLPAAVTLTGTEGGRATVNVTFNTIGLQTFTAKDSVSATRTGTAFQLVHGLVYTNPPAGGKVRLLLNAASTGSLAQLDLVSNTSLFPLGLADPLNGRVLPSSVRNGVFAAGMNLPLDTTKVGPDAQPLLVAPVASAILNLGANPQALGAAFANGIFYSGISQKRFDSTVGCTPPCTNDHLRGDVQVRPFPGANSFYYSIRLRLTPGAAPGTVFDGQALAGNLKFRAAARDRSGSDVFSGTADFAIGKLEVK